MLQFTLVKAVEYAAEVYFYAILEKGQSIPLGVNNIFDETSDSVLYEVCPLESENSNLASNEIQVEVLGLSSFTLRAEVSEDSRWFITVETVEGS